VVARGLQASFPERLKLIKIGNQETIAVRIAVILVRDVDMITIIILAEPLVNYPAELCFTGKTAVMLSQIQTAMVRKP
jgi:hypothetical protein